MENVFSLTFFAQQGQEPGFGELIGIVIFLMVIFFHWLKRLYFMDLKRICP